MCCLIFQQSICTGCPFFQWIIAEFVRFSIAIIMMQTKRQQVSPSLLPFISYILTLAFHSALFFKISKACFIFAAISFLRSIRKSS